MAVDGNGDERRSGAKMAAPLTWSNSAPCKRSEHVGCRRGAEVDVQRGWAVRGPSGAPTGENSATRCASIPAARARGERARPAPTARAHIGDSGSVGTVSRRMESAYYIEGSAACMAGGSGAAPDGPRYTSRCRAIEIGASAGTEEAVLRHGPRAVGAA